MISRFDSGYRSDLNITRLIWYMIQWRWRSLHIETRVLKSIILYAISCNFGFQSHTYGQEVLSLFIVYMWTRLHGHTLIAFHVASGANFFYRWIYICILYYTYIHIYEYILWFFFLFRNLTHRSNIPFKIPRFWFLIGRFFYGPGLSLVESCELAGSHGNCWKCGF